MLKFHTLAIFNDEYHEHVCKSPGSEFMMRSFNDDMPAKTALCIQRLQIKSSGNGPDRQTLAFVMRLNGMDYLVTNGNICLSSHLLISSYLEDVFKLLDTHVSDNDNDSHMRTVREF
jgi:hypothetical protein